ncbi:MAG: hypothetical protein WCH99_18525 [Verrucomicrobiota bacterium]
MRKHLPWLVALSAFAIPITGSACEPIIPLTQLLSGASATGSLIIGKSLLLLAMAVAIKSFSFVFLERRLPWRKAFLFMLLANVISTIPGFLIAVFAGSMSASFLALPVVFIFGMMLGNRLKHLGRPWNNSPLSGFLVALAFTVFFMLSVVLHESAGDVLGDRHYAAYWAIKFTFVTLVACTGICISAVMEEFVIARCTQKTHAGQSFYTSVFRANYITLGIILLVAALQMLPKRLHAPHFIVSWFHNVAAMLGLA